MNLECYDCEVVLVLLVVGCMDDVGVSEEYVCLLLVIMCGGVGLRFWFVFWEVYLKLFIWLFDGESLF